MKHSLSKTHAKETIDIFFKKASWTTEELRKIKRLAMKHRIKLGDYRKRFCRKCLMALRGKVRVTNSHKTIVCENCRKLNKIKIGQEVRTYQ